MSRKTDEAPLLPPDVREMTDVVLDDVDNFYHHWLAAERQALTMLEDQLDVARTGADGVVRKALTHAERNLTVTFELAHKLMQATNVGEVVRLQSEFCHTQSAALAAQMQELGEALAKASAGTFAERPRA